jgi:hypothetical protein
MSLNERFECTVKYIEQNTLTLNPGKPIGPIGPMGPVGPGRPAAIRQSHFNHHTADFI